MDPKFKVSATNQESKTVTGFLSALYQAACFHGLPLPAGSKPIPVTPEDIWKVQLAFENGPLIDDGRERGAKWDGKFGSIPFWEGWIHIKRVEGTVPEDSGVNTQGEVQPVYYPAHCPSQVELDQARMERRDELALAAPIEEIKELIPTSISGCADYLGIPMSEWVRAKDSVRVVAKARYAWADAMLEVSDKENERLRKERQEESTKNMQKLTEGQLRVIPASPMAGKSSQMVVDAREKMNEGYRRMEQALLEIYTSINFSQREGGYDVFVNSVRVAMDKVFDLIPGADKRPRHSDD